MVQQRSFSQEEFLAQKKITRRQAFLQEMEKVVPWARLTRVIAPFYPTGKRGRPPIGLERMLRVYFLQQWFGLADEAVEDALYDSLAMRIFTGIDLSSDVVPDATTLLRFRRLLEDHDLTKALFVEVNALLEEQGLLLREGTLVDATIIHAPPSTKNKEKARNPEMHQTKKGEQWYFGAKAHTGTDLESGVVHTVVSTAANVADVAVASQLLHGEEKVGMGDAGYQGVEKRAEVIEAHPEVEWIVAEKRQKVEKLPEGPIKQAVKKFEKCKASIRAKVEHPFHVLKNLFKFRKVRYRELAKTNAQLHTLFALVNLFLVRKQLVPAV